MNATFARAAIVSLIALFGSLLVVAVAVIGILGIRSATYQGQVIAGGELNTAVASNQLAREMDAAYGAGQDALRAADPATRTRLVGTLDTSLLPGIDAQLFSLQQLHAGDRRPNMPTWRCLSGSGAPSAICSARRAWPPSRPRRARRSRTS